MNRTYPFSAFVALCVWVSLLAALPMAHAGNPGSRLDEQEEVIRERLPSAVSIVTPLYNPAVRSYLNIYFNSRPQHTAEMLGWAAYYFPLFEQALASEGLPADLKYLAIVESALNPTAISRSGAGGLWQFMKPTAKEYGLRMSTYIDERMDPEKSTRAAAKFLKRLYAMFGDWELALAAYNAGPGRVRAAMKRAGSDDYWEVAKYLPTETRAYVPGFIAASYLMNYHEAHDIMPKYPEDALGRMDTLMIYKGMPLAEVAKRSGLSLDLVRRLNPVFVKGYVPASHNGFAILLPYAAAALFHSGRLMEAPPVEGPIAANAKVALDPVRTEDAGMAAAGSYKLVTTKKYHTVRSGDNLSALARKYNCTVKDLMKWNKLHDSRLAIGQRLEIRITRRELVELPVVEAPAPRAAVALAALPTRDPARIDGAPERTPLRPAVTPQLTQRPTETVMLQRRQSVRQLCTQNGLDFSDAVRFDLQTACTGELIRIN
jgi:membrane-bound lytic murein transglycosylase D